VAISGSPDIVVAEFARHWKFDYYIGTDYESRDGFFTGNKVWVASANKKEALERLANRHGFSIGKGSVGVGDTETDIKIFELVDRAICINPTAGLYKVAAKKGWEVFLERKDAIYAVKSGKINLYASK
jgi:phosphoserine phosphatase